MALNFPISPINGQQYIDGNGTVWEYNATKTVWSVKRYDDLNEFSGVKAEFNTEPSLTTVSTALPWDSTEFDTGNYIDLIDSPTKIQVARSGYYRINLLLITSTQGNGASYSFSVKQNGTIILTSDTAGPNQGVRYDEIHYLSSGDYVEVYASESGGVGKIKTTSYFEVERAGFSLGSAFSTRGVFSGVKVLLSSNVTTTVTPTALSWNSTEFNINSDINGNVYWTNTDATKIKIYTDGYYRIKSFFETGIAGSTDSYTVDVRLDGTTLESSSLGPLETLDLDEVYNFLSGSYLQVYVDNSDSVGTITNNSTFQLIRQGV